MFKINDIIVETHEWPNGKKFRTVGYIARIEQMDGLWEDKWHVILHPLPEEIAKPIRDKYLEDYNHQGVHNTYSDQYGFASHYLTKETAIVIGSVKVMGGGGHWAKAYLNGKLNI